MEKFIDHIESYLIRIENRLISINNKIDSLSNEDLNENDKLLDSHDVMKMLKISPRTLLRYRTEKILPYMMKRGTVFFLESEVQKFLKEYDSRKFDKRKRK